MKSMTGYGAAQYASKNLELDITVRSVNGRFFEPRLRLPHEYSAFEADLKKLAGQYGRRGNVDIYVNRRQKVDGGQAMVTVQTQLAKKWLKAYKELGRELKIKGDLDLVTMARLPDVIRVEEASSLSPTEQKTVVEVLKKALEKWDKERIREGKALEKELTRLLGELLSLVQSMKKMIAKANEELRKRFFQRLEAIGFEGEIDNARLSQELAIQLEKTDIQEEIIRLDEHVKSCQKLLRASGPQGKKLDFYSQELLREVNTIGSKSQIAELTAKVVSAKAVIERFREQVQNIE